MHIVPVYHAGKASEGPAGSRGRPRSTSVPAAWYDTWVSKPSTATQPIREPERVEPEGSGSAKEVAAPLVVIPTFDEAENVEPLSRDILRAVPGARLLFVDDGSPDGTGARITTLAGRDSRIRMMQRSRKLGLGSAYLAGFRHGLERGYDVVLTMDADLSHDPRYLPSILNAVSDHDLVVGSRYVEGGGIRCWPRHRRLLSRIANRTARWVLNPTITDWTSGFRAYRREMLRRLPLDRIRSSGYSFLQEITYHAVEAGFRIAEVPIVFVDRQGGRSKISSREILLAVYHLLRLRALRFTGPAPGDGSEPANERGSLSPQEL